MHRSEDNREYGMTLSYLELDSMLTALKKLVLLEEFQKSAVETPGYFWFLSLAVPVFLLKTHIYVQVP